MKFDLATTIVAAIVGVAIAFFVTNLIMPGFSSVRFETLPSSASATLTEPNPDIFNFRALNPTVEVYVGSGTEGE